jgi:hypothetical protein
VSEDSTTGNTSEGRKRVARTALLAALASIHPSRRRPPAGFLVGDQSQVLSREQAIDALAQLPKPVLLQAALRTDGIVRLSRPLTSLAEALQRHLTSGDTEAQQARDAESDLPTHIHQLLVRAGAEEYLLSRSEYYAFGREYHFMHGGHAVDRPDAAARAKGADALLTFDPADRAA